MRLRQTKAATALEGGTCGLAWCPVGASVYPRPAPRVRVMNRRARGPQWCADAGGLVMGSVTSDA